MKAARIAASSPGRYSRIVTSFGPSKDRRGGGSAWESNCGLLQLNQDAWLQLQDVDADTRNEIAADVVCRRRKLATLLEECCLRTAKIQPLFRKLQSLNKKLKQLEGELNRARKHPDRFDPEDLYVRREELDGIRGLVLE